jgi:Zn ribbon nucleic-acid-binding protein
MEPKELTAGDPCPNCAGTMRVDQAQHRHAHRSPQAQRGQSAVAARFAEQVKAKAEDKGLIHTCIGCGYQARYKLAEQPADKFPPPPALPAPAGA